MGVPSAVGSKLIPPLYPAVRDYITKLEGALEQVDTVHCEAANELAIWAASKIARGEEANVIIICTGNSRRSIMGSVTGIVAACFYNLPNLHFYSGGTSRSALNPRTAMTLRAVGFDVSETGDEAPRGDEGTPNPVFTVKYGSGSALEFSKAYNDASNPQRDFAALLVCTEADDACPSLIGASVRIPCPFTDPKEFDGTTSEAACYAGKRDEIGRFMVLVTRKVAEIGRK